MEIIFLFASNATMLSEVTKIAPRLQAEFKISKQPQPSTYISVMLFTSGRAEDLKA